MNTIPNDSDNIHSEQIIHTPTIPNVGLEGLKVDMEMELLTNLCLGEFDVNKLSLSTMDLNMYEPDEHDYEPDEHEEYDYEHDEPEGSPTKPKKSNRNRNRGFGAGGKNTNLHGKQFEEKTSNVPRLIADGYELHNIDKRKSCYMIKRVDDATIIYTSQHGFNHVIKQRYNIDSIRCPDEAYIYEYADGKRVVRILEKKEQHVEGSVDTKLLAGPAFRREYELVLGDGFTVHYGFCVNKYFADKFASTNKRTCKKYGILRTILEENNIAVLYGDDADYFEQLDRWLREPTDSARAYAL